MYEMAIPVSGSWKTGTDSRGWRYDDFFINVDIDLNQHLDNLININIDVNVNFDDVEQQHINLNFNDEFDNVNYQLNDVYHFVVNKLYQLFIDIDDKFNDVFNDKHNLDDVIDHVNYVNDFKYDVDNELKHHKLNHLDNEFNNFDDVDNVQYNLDNFDNKLNNLDELFDNDNGAADIEFHFNDVEFQLFDEYHNVDIEQYLVFHVNEFEFNDVQYDQYLIVYDEYNKHHFFDFVNLVDFIKHDNRAAAPNSSAA